MSQESKIVALLLFVVGAVFACTAWVFRQSDLLIARLEKLAGEE